MNINPNSYKAIQLMMNGILALGRAEQAGIRVDVEYVERKKERLTKKIARLEDNFKQSKFFRHWQHTVKGTINIYSNAQLSYYLYSVKNVKVVKETATGQGSTDEDALTQLNIPELNDLLEIRKLKKVRDTYLDGFAREQVNGFIHPFFNLHLVRTYRSSSDGPNLQNIPIRDEESMQICRRALFPRVGNQLLEADFSGLEVRIAACYHKDPTMLKYINDPSSDMHADMAKQIFKLTKFDKKIPAHYTMRQAAKNGFVFPEFYGDYYKNCAVGICEWMKLPQTKWSAGQGIAMPEGTVADHMIAKGIPSFLKFEGHLQAIETDFWNVRFPDYQRWKERWWQEYQRNGFVDMYTGFRCSGMMSRNDCINYPVQGAAFHCLLWSFTRVDEIARREGWQTRLIGQIHDSMLLDVYPPELPHVVETIRNVTCVELPAKWEWIIVPLTIDMDVCPVDEPWSEKAKLVL